YDLAFGIPLDLAAEFFDRRRRGFFLDFETAMHSRCDLIEPFVHLDLREPFPAKYYTSTILGSRNIFQRVRIQQNEIGNFSFFDSSGLCDRAEILMCV